MLRGTRVFARCDQNGALVEQGGRVEIRYRQGDGKAYRAAKGNLDLTGGPIFTDDHVGEAEPVPRSDVPRKKSTSKAGGKQAAAPAAVEAGAVVAYTDGACSGNPGPCGLGVVLERSGTVRELSEYLGTGTNNIAELTAILRALEADDSDATLVVHTDSKYAIGVLSKGWKAKANQQLIATIKQAMAVRGAVRLVYVPGHAGVPLNERADALARASVEARRSAGWREVRSKS